MTCSTKFSLANGRHTSEIKSCISQIPSSRILTTAMELLQAGDGVTWWLWARLGLGQWLVCVSPVTCPPLSHLCLAYTRALSPHQGLNGALTQTLPGAPRSLPAPGTWAPGWGHPHPRPKAPSQGGGLPEPPPLALPTPSPHSHRLTH